MIVIDRIAADAMAKVLVKASGLNSRPLSPPSTNTGMKTDRDDQEAEEEAGTDFLRGLHDDVAAGSRPRSPAREAFFFAVKMLVCVLHHDDRAVHDHADRDGDSAQAHDVGVDAQDMHHQHADQHADGITKMATSELRACSKNKMHTRRDDEHFLDQRMAKRVYRSLDQI